MNEQTYHKKLDHIFATLKKHGFKEHVPPSRERWHYRKQTERGNYYVTINFGTCQTEASYYPKD